MMNKERTGKITHKIYDFDTGKLICTLPLRKGGLEPKYRVIKIKVKNAKSQ